MGSAGEVEEFVGCGADESVPYFGFVAVWGGEELVEDVVVSFVGGVAYDAGFFEEVGGAGAAGEDAGWWLFEGCGVGAGLERGGLWVVFGGVVGGAVGGAVV